MKDPYQKNLAHSWTSPSATTVFQVQSTQQSVELRTREFNALLTFGGNGQLKNAKLKSLVPNTESVSVPEQNLDPVALTIEKQEQVARQRVLVERLLGHTPQTIEAKIHVNR